jgi:hypothetical protein
MEDFVYGDAAVVVPAQQFAALVKIIGGDGGADGFLDPLAEAVDEKFSGEWRAHVYLLFDSSF